MGASHSPKLQTTGTSPSDRLVSLPGLSFLIPLQRSSRCILQPKPTGQYWPCAASNLSLINQYAEFFMSIFFTSDIYCMLYSSLFFLRHVLYTFFYLWRKLYTVRISLPEANTVYWTNFFAHSAGTVEYTRCFCAEE